MQSTHPSHEMQSALPELPSRVMNYRVTSASPTEELLTLGRIFAEVGDYAGSILDPRHLSLARRCATRLKKVVAELVARGSIRSADALYEISPLHTSAPTVSAPCASFPASLSAMTIDELHALYRQWPLRREQRQREGRDTQTCYYESLIISEMQRRKAITRTDRFKIDYCTATHRNALITVALALNLPLCAAPSEAMPWEVTSAGLYEAAPHSSHTCTELAEIISRCSNYRDVAGRERLVAYVDIALDQFASAPSEPSSGLLRSVLASLRTRHLIAIPPL